MHSIYTRFIVSIVAALWPGMMHAEMDATVTPKSKENTATLPMTLPQPHPTTLLKNSLMFSKEDMQLIMHALEESLIDPLELLGQQQAATETQGPTDTHNLSLLGGHRVQSFDFKSRTDAPPAIAAPPVVEIMNNAKASTPLLPPPPPAPPAPPIQNPAEPKEELLDRNSSPEFVPNPAAPLPAPSPAPAAPLLKKAPIFTLESIFYMGPHQWMISVNGQLIASEDRDNEVHVKASKDSKDSLAIKILNVTEDAAVISWHCSCIVDLSPHITQQLYKDRDSYSNIAETIRLNQSMDTLEFILHLNQSFSIGLMQIEEWPDQDNHKNILTL